MFRFIERPDKTATGKFIGSTSCGFVTGNTYRLRIFTSESYIWVSDTQSCAKCPYSSIQTLAQNWEIPVKRDTPNEHPVSNNIWKG